MIVRIIKWSFFIWLIIGSLQAQSSWFLDLNTGLYNHSVSTNKNFVNNLEEKGFTQQPHTAVQFDFITGKKWPKGWHLGAGYKTLRLETKYSLTTTFEQPTGIQEMTETINYQSSLNFFQCRVGYDHHFSGNWMLGLRLSVGFDPNPDMYIIESREEKYAFFDQINHFEQGRRMPEADRAAYFGAIELSVGKRFNYFSIFLYGRITGIRQQQDMRYPLTVAEPPYWIRHVDSVTLKHQINELGVSIRIPIWFIP